MSADKPQWNPYGPNPGPGYQWPPGGGWGPAGPYGWAGQQGGPQWNGAQGPGPQGPGPQPARRIDALDVLEGMLQDGFSLSQFTRIARASGSNFWVGAAIGAGLVVLVNRPEVREAVAKVFGAGAEEPKPTPPAAGTPE